MGTLNDLSIKKKLIAIQFLTTFIVLICCSVVYVINDLGKHRNSLVNHLSSTAQIIGENTISPLQFLDDDAANEILAALKGEASIVNASIYDAEDALFATYSKEGHSDFTFPKIKVASHQFSTGNLILARQIARNEEALGTIYLRSDMREFREKVKQYIKVAVLVLLAGGIVALALSTWMQKAISQPVVDLVGTAHKVSRTSDYSIRAEKTGNDELGALCDAFNGMLMQIQRRDAELRKAQEVLEERVDERTSELQATLEALQEREESYRNLVDDIPGLVYRCTLDANWTMHFISDMVEEVTGYPAQDFILNQNRTFDSIIHPNDRAMVSETVQQALQQGNPHIIEYRLLHADGSMRWVYERGRQVGGKDGKAAELEGVIFDITERRQAEDELRAAKETVEVAFEELKATQAQLVESEKMAALGGLVAGVAHEVNTPVGIGVTVSSTLEKRTKQFVDLAKSGAMKRRDLTKFLDGTVQSSQMLLKHLNRAAELIQSFKQVAVDQSSEERRTFAVKSYLKEILLSLRPKLKRSQHRVTIRCDDALMLDSFPGE